MRRVTSMARARGVLPQDEAAGGSARGPEDPAVAALLEAAMRRLEETVDMETAALRNRQPIDLNEFNTRKNQGLLELDRALRMLGGAQPSESMLAHLGRLHRKLDVNREVLKIHLEAVREVAAIIAEAMRSADSDGTYSLAFRSKGPAP